MVVEEAGMCLGDIEEAGGGMVGVEEGGGEECKRR